MKRLFPLLALVLNFPAEAQDYQLPPPLELHYRNHRLVIPQADEHGKHDWYGDACRGGIESSVVHSVAKRGDTLYVVFTCAGWSRGQAQTRGRCGAGWEHQINWMAIRGGAVIAHLQHDIESCWRDTSGSIDGWRHGVLIWGSEGIETGYSAFYDPKAPDKGLQLKETHKLPLQ